MEVQLERCSRSDRWVKDISAIVEELQREFTEVDSIWLYGSDTVDIVPVKYIQSSRELIVFKKEHLYPTFYKEALKVFCFFSDTYYITHDNYYNFLEKVGRLQTKALSTYGFSYVNLISDLMDIFVMCTLSGKYAKSIKKFKLDKNVLQVLYKEINRTYKIFNTNPYLSLNAACIKSLIENFYGITGNIVLPDYQSARISLTRVEGLVKQSVVSRGYHASFALAEQFYNLASVFINSSIHNVEKVKKF